MAQDDRPLTQVEIDDLLKSLRREHPHTYHVPGATSDDPGLIVCIRHASIPHGKTVTGREFELAARELARLATS